MVFSHMPKPKSCRFMLPKTTLMSILRSDQTYTTTSACYEHCTEGLNLGSETNKWLRGKNDWSVEEGQQDHCSEKEALSWHCQVERRARSERATMSFQALVNLT